MKNFSCDYKNYHMNRLRQCSISCVMYEYFAQFKFPIDDIIVHFSQVNLFYFN